jgi:hypothetical protein
MSIPLLASLNDHDASGKALQSGENACSGPEWTAFGKESKIKFDQNVLEMVFPNAG